MAALSEDAKREWREADVLVCGVQAGANVRQGSVVAVDADGRVAPATGAAGLTVLGWAIEPADNTGGAAGAMNVTVRHRGALRLPVKAGDSPDVGDVVYCENDNDVTTTSGGRSRLGRVIAEAGGGSTDVFVEIDLG